MNQNKFFLELPDEVYQRLEAVIQKTVAEALQKHVDAIHAVPNLLSREETAKLLRVSLPTLHTYEASGRLIPQRAGRKLLYDRKAINEFLKR
jgi:2-phosphoglycerate kinase